MSIKSSLGLKINPKNKIQELENFRDELHDVSKGPNFQGRSKILTEKFGFKCSDPDNYQFYIKLGDKKFHYITLTEYGIISETINLNDFSFEDKKSAINSNGYDLAKVRTIVSSFIQKEKLKSFDFSFFIHIILRNYSINNIFIS